jgi:hypothetical protein
MADKVENPESNKKRKPVQKYYMNFKLKVEANYNSIVIISHVLMFWRNQEDNRGIKTFYLFTKDPNSANKSEKVRTYWYIP